MSCGSIGAVGRRRGNRSALWIRPRLDVYSQCGSHGDADLLIADRLQGYLHRSSIALRDNGSCVKLWTAISCFSRLSRRWMVRCRFSWALRCSRCWSRVSYGSGLRRMPDVTSMRAPLSGPVSFLRHFLPTVLVRYSLS